MLLALLSSVAILSLTPCAGHTQPQDVKASRLFELAKPATVLIEATCEVTASWPVWHWSGENVRLFHERASRRAENRGIDDMILARSEELLENFNDYLAPQDARRTETEASSAQGSGFVITPDGYVVTNAHVVVWTDEDLESVIEELNKKRVAASMEVLAKDEDFAGGSDEAMANVEEALQSWCSQHIKIDKKEVTALVAAGVAVPGVASEYKGSPAEIVAVGEPAPGKDVAILKVAGNNMQTLPLGDDKAINPGDRVYVVGYPAAATFHPYLKQDVPHDPTLTAGVVSAKKAMPGDWEVMQTDADFTHGNSGGPALDSAGRVIGIATFGSLEPTASGQDVTAVPGMNWLIPVSIAMEFLQRHNIKPQEGTVSKLYAQALDAFDAHHYRKALAIFQQINTISPAHPYVQSFISKSQQAIVEGKDRASVPMLIVGIVILLAVLVALTIFLPRWRHPVAKSMPPPPVMPG